LINETNAANNLFTTPQKYGAIGDGVADDTDAFIAAEASGKPIYVPPGSYKLTRNFGSINPVTSEITSNFFGLGGITWVNGFSGFAWLKFDLMGSQGASFSTARVNAKTPTSDNHLTSKFYVDQKDSVIQNSLNSVSSNLQSEITNRSNADDAINIRIDTEIQNRQDLQTYTDTNFFRKNTTNQASGGVFSFRSADDFLISNTSGSFTGLEVIQNQTGADATMRFHVIGDFAGYFGLAGDLNDFAVGGYSFGANKHRILHKGNISQFIPVSGNWWNNGFVRVDTNGNSEIGTILDFHSQNSGTSDADARISTSSDGTFLGFSKPGNTGCVTFDLVAGNVQLTSKTDAGEPHLILRSDALSVEDPAFINSPGYQGNDYCVSTMVDQRGGARFRGMVKRSGMGVPALLLEGLKNDDGQIIGEWAKVSVNAFGLSAGGVGVGSNAEDNIFGVYDNGSVRMIVKGDGRIFAPDCTVAEISSSNDKVLTTKGYIDNLFDWAWNFEPVVSGDVVGTPSIGNKDVRSWGWKKLGNNFMIQWVQATIRHDVGTNFTISLPTSFSNACLGAWLTVGRSDSVTGNFAMYLTGRTQNTVSIIADPADTDATYTSDIYILAIGY
jgi:hypothetical protein